MMGRKLAKRCLMGLLTVALVITMIPMVPFGNGQAYGAIATEQPVVVVSGSNIVGASYSADNVSKERAYTLSELKGLTSLKKAPLYSAINSSETKSIFKGEGVDLAGLLALSGFTATADKKVVAAEMGAGLDQSFGSTLDLSQKRYYYPNFAGGSASGSVEVPAILAWADGGNKGELSTSITLKDRDALKLMVGQTALGDINNSLYNSAVNYVYSGSLLTEKALTVDGKAYSRSEVLMMPRGEKSYSYSTQGGDRTDYVRGVPFAVLLEGKSSDEIINFEAADGYDMSKASVTVGQAIANNYILAYEKGTSKSDLKGIYSDVEGNAKIYGFFTLYGDGIKPSKMISAISVGSGGAGAGAGAGAALSDAFKHVTNGGKSGSAPYNIDAITGATLTVEGPGVNATTPLRIGDIEKTDSANLYQGAYTDTRSGKATTMLYQGVKVLSIVEGLVNDGVSRVDDDVKVIFKNRWRQNVATMSYSELKNAKTPVILAYGTGTGDGSQAAPFVFDGDTGAVAALANEDGPIKLVYDKAEFPKVTSPDKFSSVAYLYVELADPETGYKHTTATDDAYRNSANTQQLITFTGSVLGREVNYTVEELEAMVQYGADGKPVAGGLGYRAEYNLSNTTYWYVNEYEGIKLWELLTHKMGVDAKKYAGDDKTLVSFASWDNYKTTAQFSMKQLASPDLFYYYEKSPSDIGTSRPTKAQLAQTAYQPDNQGSGWVKDANGYPVKKGYPVMLAYGVNGYPYVRSADLDGFAGGLGNDGGPIRVIFGKADNMNRDNKAALENYAYFYNNGSNQLQRAQEIYVGDDTRYSTHLENPAYTSMAKGTALTVEVIQSNGQKETKTYTLAQLESLLYGSDVSKSDREKQGRVEKGYYAHKVYEDSLVEDLFEGVSLWYLLSEDVGMQGYLGTISFYEAGSSTSSLMMNLAEVQEEGYNSLRDTSGLGSMVAFAKNGYPLVADKNSAGYVSEDAVTGKTVKNSDGPLMFVRPQTAAEKAAGKVAVDNAAAVKNLSKIVVNLEADKYAHTDGAYAAYGNQTVQFTGSVKDGGVSLKISDLEKKQKYLVTGSYTVDGKARTYRGLDLSALLLDPSIGASALMNQVTVKNAAGQSKVLSVADLTVNGQKVILAYGIGNPAAGAALSDGKPLVKTASDNGYVAAYGNSGGPLRLIIPGGSGADCIQNVTAIEVAAGVLDGWTHSTGHYLDYATYGIAISGSNSAKELTLSVPQIEAMAENYKAFDSYKMSNEFYFEGVDLMKILRDYVGFADGLASSNITVYASDGYGTAFTATDLSDGVNGKPIILAYGQGVSPDRGLPLVEQDTSPGYDPEIGNAFGPLRLVVNDNTGWCVKWATSIVVGTGEPMQPVVEGGAVAAPAVAETVYGFDWFEGTGEVGSLPMASVRDVVADADGGVWVGTNGGGAWYKGPGESNFSINTLNSAGYQLESDVVQAISVDGDGGVWFSQSKTYDPAQAALNKGVAYLKDGKLTYYNTGVPGTIPNDYVQEVKVAADGSVWFGSFGGLTKYDPATGQWKTWTKADGLPAASVDNIEFDGAGGVWIGCYPDFKDMANGPFTGGYAHLAADGTLTAYVAGEGETTDPARLADSWVRDIAVDAAGGAWVVRSGSYTYLENVGGRVDYVAADGTVTHYTGHELIPALADTEDNAEVRMVNVDSEGNVLFGTSGLGIYQFKDGAIQRIYSSANYDWPGDARFDNVYVLNTGADGALYAGSDAGIMLGTAKTVKFGDIAGHWAKDTILYLAANDIVNGKSETAFDPQGKVTRAEFLAMLSRTSDIDLTAAASSGFADVADSAWYASYVNWSVANGVVKGFPDGTFKPEATISRQEMAVMTERFLKVVDVTPEKVNEAKTFSDQGAMGAWAAPSVGAMQEYGIINGNPDGSFRPAATATRAEAGTIIRSCIGASLQR